MTSEMLYIVCPQCQGAGEVGSQRMGQEYIYASDVGDCTVCNTIGFIETGLSEGIVENLRKELRDCYRMIEQCVSLVDVMRNGLSEALLNRARIEAEYNHSFQDLPEDSDDDDKPAATYDPIDYLDK